MVRMMIAATAQSAKAAAKLGRSPLRLIMKGPANIATQATAPAAWVRADTIPAS
jgi:hypothetical protein